MNLNSSHGGDSGYPTALDLPQVLCSQVLQFKKQKLRRNLANISPASRVLWGPACECRRLTSHKSRRLIMSIRTLMSEQKRPSLALVGAIALRPDQLERFTNPGESQSPSLQSQNLRGLDDALGMPRRT